jgi:MFS family permease
VLLITGFGAAFQGPAGQALLAATVDPSLYHSAATWSSSSWQIAAMLGPTLGGLLIAVFKAAWPIYLLDALGCLFFIAVLLTIRERKLPLSKEPVTRQTITAGVKFLWNTKIVLGAITLDMFAVLFGGAVALLPIYARDILMVGPEGLGVMRAMPSIGALLVALIIASRPPFERAGRTLLISVAGFGVATIIFGLSTHFWLSCVALFALGGLDNISVVVRHTLMLTRIPDDMRGRVSAVNSMFIGISNELGTFESGLTAAIMGTVGAVVFGGVGTLVVVAVIAWKIPELRMLKRLI